jgi:hypothetical protein
MVALAADEAKVAKLPPSKPQPALSAVMKPSRRQLATDRFAAMLICLAVLLAGCGGSVRGDASAGPNPGGGFYSPSNIDNGRVNP